MKRNVSQTALKYSVTMCKRKCAALIKILRFGEGNFTGAIDDCEQGWVHKVGRTETKGMFERIQEP